MSDSKRLVRSNFCSLQPTQDIFPFSRRRLNKIVQFLFPSNFSFLVIFLVQQSSLIQLDGKQTQKANNPSVFKQMSRPDLPHDGGLLGTEWATSLIPALSSASRQAVNLARHPHSGKCAVRRPPPATRCQGWGVRGQHKQQAWGT